MGFSCSVLPCSPIFIVFSSSLITLLGEERTDCSAYRALVCLLCVCSFVTVSLPLSAMSLLWLVLMAARKANHFHTSG